MTAEKGKTRNRDRFTGLIGPLRDRLEAVIAEYREWAETYQLEYEIEETVFDKLIRDGDGMYARVFLRSYCPTWNQQGSSGMFNMAMAHARNIANAWSKLHRAEKRAITNPRLIRVG